VPEPASGLVDLTAAHAAVVVGWVPTAADVVLFAGDSLVHPLTATQLVTVASVQNRVPKVLLADSQPVAFGALTFREDGVRLGWVVTDPDRRGRGYGRSLVTGLLEVARTARRPVRVSLGVYEHNTVARALYADLGFVEAGERQHRVVDGRDWVSITLERTLSRR